MSARPAARGAGALALVLAWSLLLACFPLRDLDWGWHLATFERWMAEGRLPWDDQFAWGSEGAYEPVHCLFQLLIGWLHRALGLPGLVAARMGLHAAIALALHGALRRRGLSPWTAAALALVVLAGSTSRLLERPHLFTTLGLVLLLDRLLAARDRGAHPWPLVPLLALWANAHPGVVFGALALGGFVLAELGWHLLARRAGSTPAVPLPRLLRLVAWSAAALVATGLNPLSFDLYPYLVAHRGMQGAIDVAELRGLFQHRERGVDVHSLVTGLWLAGAALGLRRPRRVDPTLGLMALAFAGLAVILAREAPLALIVLALAIAPALRGVERAAPGARAALLALALVPAGLGALERLARGVGFGLEPGQFAVGPAEWILAHRPRGRLWNTNYTGGYLVWRLAREPDGWQVHTDGRMPMFGRALLLDRDFARLDALWRPEIAVVDWTERATAFYAFEDTASFQREWVLVHVSAGGKLYLRREGQNPLLVERFGYRELRWLGRFLRPPGDPEAFARELERARREDPSNPHLPPPAAR